MFFRRICILNEPIQIKNKIDPSQDIRTQQNKAATFGGGKYRIDYDRYHNDAVRSENEKIRNKNSFIAVFAAFACLFVFILCGIFIFRYFADTIRMKIDSGNENYSLSACYESTEGITKLSD